MTDWVSNLISDSSFTLSKDFLISLISVKADTFESDTVSPISTRLLLIASSFSAAFETQSAHSVLRLSLLNGSHFKSGLNFFSWLKNFFFSSEPTESVPKCSLLPNDFAEASAKHSSSQLEPGLPILLSSPKLLCLDRSLAEFTSFIWEEISGSVALSPFFNEPLNLRRRLENFRLKDPDIFFCGSLALLGSNFGLLFKPDSLNNLLLSEPTLFVFFSTLELSSESSIPSCSQAD
mmetsp:Transcript_10910/g.13186  ORF Transcript_10910/g.13186 Transcript_10910/m.13186 type:complete len:235 (-) Transcript_10910:331-1035(-)